MRNDAIRKVHHLTPRRALVSRALAPALAAMALASIPAWADPPVCNDPVACADGADCAVDDPSNAHFQVAFVSAEPALCPGGGAGTKFTYKACELVSSPDLSHWVLGLCPTLSVCDFSGGSSQAVGCDPTTALFGMKWNTEGGVVDCSPMSGTCPTPDGDVFTVTFAGNVPVSTSPSGVVVNTKAGNLWLGDACVTGPVCTTGTTTTTTAPTTTTTSSTATTTTATTSTSTSTTTTSTTTSSTSTTDPGATTTTTPTTLGLPETTTTTEQTTTTTTELITTSTTEPITTTTTTATTSTTTTTRPECQTDPDCNDNNPCTTDACEGGVCTHGPVTGLPAETSCNDMQDNDCNGLIDCADPNCVNITPCRPARKDPTSITFGHGGVGRDRFKTQAKLTMTPTDLTQLEIDVGLSNSTGAIYKGALIAHDLVSYRGGALYRFSDPGARFGRGKRFGISRVKIKKLGDDSGYTVKFEVYANLQAAAAPDADAKMRVQFYIGDDTFITAEAPWSRTASGWRAPKDH